MLRTHLAAALRNLAQNRLHAGLNILGLAIGFATVILIALYVRNELSFDRALPGAERTYLVVDQGIYAVTSPAVAAHWQGRAGVVAVTRVAEDQAILHHDGQTSPRGETIAYADPDLAQVLSLHVLYGRLDGALDAPDSAVITRRIAQIYFGMDNPIGRTMQVTLQSDPKGTYPVRVTAVLKDLPAETTWTAEVLLSGRAAFSTFNYHPAWPCPTCLGAGTTRTYVRLVADAKPPASLIPIGRLHQSPALRGLDKPSVEPSLLWGLVAVGALVVVIAAMNFVTLVTARMDRRAIEVAVRKAAGARRSDLIGQFVLENALLVTLGLIVGVAAVEWLIDPLNRLLGRDISFDWVGDLGLVGLILGLWAATALLAAAWPALVLSGYRPAKALRAGTSRGRAGDLGRTAVVVVQFALLTGLMISTGVIWRQTAYAMGQGTHLDMTGVIIAWNCKPAVRAAVAALPGVEATTCSTWNALSPGDAPNLAAPAGTIAANYVDYGFFDLYGIKPLAGRVFDQGQALDHGSWENPPAGDDGQTYRLRRVVVNAAAARALGFASPAAAIGRMAGVVDGVVSHPAEIIGVVPDFSAQSVRRAVTPAAYGIMPYPMEMMSVRLDPGHFRQTRARVNAVLGKPSYRLTGYIANQFADMQRLSIFLALCAATALLVAGLGLFGLSAVAAERRRREIAVRRALGAGRVDIAHWLARRYTWPVVLANLVAWPAAWALTTAWLDGFADHVTPAPWIFLAAGAGTLAIAWSTVGLHGLIVAGLKPARALRDA